MVSLHNSPSIHHAWLRNASTQAGLCRHGHYQRNIAFYVRSEQVPAASTSLCQDRLGRTPTACLGSNNCSMEVIVEGQDKVFKDVIEPLESVSVNLIPTSKQDIRDFGSPQEVAETLIKRVLASPLQKTKLVQASEHDVDGKAYYTIEFIAQAPNYTRHALSAICVGNGKFYTLTTGANERRWEKIKDRLETVVDSFEIFNV
ncbi:PsbP-like protein 1 [Abeliophyllum distichum]|uniref:PsbP-like protein 1 n=1 Tax=Abeliophyllum distichum TaxID=126358 RepID=A0ABD1PDP0_9LAMI